MLINKALLRISFTYSVTILKISAIRNTVNDTLINTTVSFISGITLNLFIENICAMFRIVVYACVVQAVVCIIVTDAPPTSTEYNYWYNIVDPSTGDTKSAQEIRHGNIVKGSYSVVDPDGIKRTVDYTAGGSHGFKAVVRNEPITNFLNQRSKQQQHYSSVPVQSYGYQAPVKQVKTPVLSNSKFVKSPVYFTPGNDTSSERGNFKQGEFFKPNYMHK